MSWRSRFVGGLLLGLPVPVLAQTVKSESLVGTWVSTFDLDSTSVAHDSLVFSADGTLKRTYVGKWPPPETVVRDFEWSLSSDTLWTKDGKLKAFSIVRSLEDGQKLELRGGIIGAVMRDPLTYTRVNSGKP